MKRIAKYLGIAALVLVLGITLAGWALNRWLNSPELHAALDQEFSRALRMPVKTEGVSFSVWSGLAVRSLAVPGAEGESTFEFSGLSASHRLLPLLRGKLVLADVDIIRPRLRLVENATGGWRMPGVRAKAITTAVSDSPPAVSTGQLSVPQSPPPASAQKKNSSVVIERVLVSCGSLELIGKSHAPIATASGISAKIHNVNGENLSGSIVIGRVTLHGCFALDNLATLFGRVGNEIRFSQIFATSGGGSVSGEAVWTPGGGGNADLNLANINVARTAKDAGAANPRIGGVLAGSAKLAGIGTDRNALTGGGHLTLAGASTREIEVLRQIGDALQIAAIASFEISTVTADFTVAQGRVLLSPADVTAQPVALSLTGTAAFDGALDLAGTLHAPADFIAKHTLIAPQFSAPDAAGRRAVQFKVTGSLFKPRQNLAEQLTGTKDRREQNIIAAGTAATAILENTSIGKHNQKLLKMLPQLLPVKKKAPDPAPEPAPAPQ